MILYFPGDFHVTDNVAAIIALCVPVDNFMIKFAIDGFAILSPEIFRAELRSASLSRL
jgi:hypothetical protein